ncbi:macrolide transport system ATP-binding/permease protein [Natranaerovirga hydrolytica]|uniref:Macrolide transport system ATP-binding/permease protein n=1 Tax=Natranaerovirga hydrolytica TaxID=680378 RepID=A0A4R1MNN3_9FIRM|nr:ABC-F type ribosomal protection protein [Natranaerovirga hydrolytica]TCK92914.1 macrolide transport system ATP-binding/permease protein [Natranaerovirga hydrolytica]
MLLIESQDVQISFGHRMVLKYNQLNVDDKDRIGIVGVNGSGKSTLMKLLSKKIEPDEGNIQLYSKFSYISQLEKPINQTINDEVASRFKISKNWSDTMSGGEKTRFKLAQALSLKKPLIFADEPTSHLDMEGIELLEKHLKTFKGALLIISHDRMFLDHLCNKILEVENGKIKMYTGNYSDYEIQKKKEVQSQWLAYEQYQKEKNRLKTTLEKTQGKSNGINRSPKRMGNAEARLHKMGGQKAKKNLDKTVKSIQSRIEALDHKSKPKEEETIAIDPIQPENLHKKIIIKGQWIKKEFDNKVVFNNAKFNIYNGDKVAILGANGSGKTTLVKMMLNECACFKISPKVKIGYYSQAFEGLNNETSILDNVMERSIQSETFVRTLLARLLFKKEDVYKKVKVLSGGERVKVALAKILLSDSNVLILDEPTNYLDIPSFIQIEKLLMAYKGTLILITHDRQLITHTANHIMVIENKKIKSYRGTYKAYLEVNHNKTNKNKALEEEILVLQNRISEIIGKMSMASEEEMKLLDQEYYNVLGQLQILKKEQ